MMREGNFLTRVRELFIDRVWRDDELLLGHTYRTR